MSKLDEIMASTAAYLKSFECCKGVILDSCTVDWFQGGRSLRPTLDLSAAVDLHREAAVAWLAEEGIQLARLNQDADCHKWVITYPPGGPAAAPKFFAQLEARERRRVERKASIPNPEAFGLPNCWEQWMQYMRE